MGEYFIICNVDRKEVLDPGVFGHGYKPGDLLFNATSKGVLHGLLHLLSLSGSVGGIQRRETDPLFGRWAGNRIALIGDYYLRGSAGILGARTTTWIYGTVKMAGLILANMSCVR